MTWVERRFGFAVAQAYAGHQNASQGTRAIGATGTYVRAGLPEVATALSTLTGESHPLTPGRITYRHQPSFSRSLTLEITEGTAKAEPARSVQNAVPLVTGCGHELVRHLSERAPIDYAHAR